MKKIYTLTFGFLFFAGVNAQQISLSFPAQKSMTIDKCERKVQQGDLQVSQNSASFKTETAVDTAGAEFMQDNLSTYNYSQSGQTQPIFGPNSLGDKAFAQIYPYWGAGFNLEKVLLRFWAKAGTGTPVVEIYDVASGKPSTAKGSQSMPMANIDTSFVTPQFTVVDFTTPVAITTQFAVAIDGSSHTSTGTWGLFSTTQDDSHNSLNARIFGSPGNGEADDWHSVEEFWGNSSITNPNLIILPVVSGAYNTGISETQEINGIKLTQSYPNPAKDMAKIEYQINENVDVSFLLIDATGKVVLTRNEGKQSAGVHTMVLNVSQLPAGNYFYSLKAGDRQLTKQFTIQ